MDEQSSHLLEVRDLHVEFHTSLGTIQAVDGISYYVDRGETLAILGESGSGKSVGAAAILNLIDTPPGYITDGQIYYHGRDLLKMSSEERREINGRQIAMIFQDTLAHLNPVYSVGWQIAETFRAHNQCTPGEANTRAVELLGRVGIPDPAIRAGQYPHQFSGGQRQRVMIAMALALEPDLLIADEPTTALDVTVQAQILDLLKRLQTEEGMGLVLITHDLGVAADMADRVAVMHAGKIVEQGPVGRIFRDPQHSYTRRLMTSTPGQVEDPDHQVPAAGRDAVLLEVKDVAKHYEVTSGLLRRRTGDVVRAVDGVSFDLTAGETLGIVGESGSGKSTLGRTILRLEDPTRGTVVYRGRDIFALGSADLLAFRRKVQVVFQDPYSSLNPRMNVSTIVSEPWAIHRDALPKRQWADGVVDLLEKVGLEADHARRYPHQFSGGQRQRIAIARALALQPELIICDEAVSALDVSIQAQVIALLAQLRDEMGLAYIFIAHDLHVVEHFADRVLVMQAGRVVEQGTSAQIFASPEHPYTRALLAASPVPDPEVQAARRRQEAPRRAVGL